MPHKSYVTYDMAYATVKFTEDIEQGKFYRHDMLKLKEILELFDLVLLGEDAESREMAPLLFFFFAWSVNNWTAREVPAPLLKLPCKP